MRVERVDFVSIPTRDLARAKAFYGDVLGLEHEKDTPVGAEYRAGQVTFAVWDPRTMGLEFSPVANEIALRVADVGAARTELEGLGVRFKGEILDTGVCHMAFFDDPDGNALMLHRRYAP
jgi:catechol 2,3-dioxygenase-like lactoylglutathione lyase family enzyme